MASTTTKTSEIAGDIMQISSIGHCQSGGVRVCVGKAITGRIRAINGQLLAGLCLNQTELLRFLTQTSLNTMDIDSYPTPMISDDPTHVAKTLVGDTHNNDKDENENDHAYSIHFLTIPDGILGAKLERIEGKSLSNESIDLQQALAGGYRVAAVTPRCLHLSLGDIVLAINGISLSFLSNENAQKLLREPERRLTVVRISRVLLGVVVDSPHLSTTTANPLASQSLPCMSKRALSSPSAEDDSFPPTKLLLVESFSSTSSLPILSSVAQLHHDWTAIRSKYLHRQLFRPSTSQSLSTELTSAFYNDRHALFDELVNYADH
jgi:hypothetical protein